MRNTGWSKFGYYPTPERVTPMICSRIARVMYWKRPATEWRAECWETRVMDPCCGEGAAVSELSERLRAALDNMRPASFESSVVTYGVEVEEERAREARKTLDQVWHADIDSMRIVPTSFDYLWLNPPYDWADQADDAATRLESRFLHQTTWGLKPGGTLVYIVPRHVLKWDAHFLSQHYQGINVARFPDPEYGDYRQVVAIATKRDRSLMGGDAHAAETLRRLAEYDTTIEVLSEGKAGTHGRETTYGNHGWPARRMLFNPAEVATALRAEGVWNTRDMRETLSTDINQTRMRPIETLHEGHAAMVAANSMMDNVVIQDPQGEGDPIVLRGFFRKVSRETETGDNQITKTDYFESNIRALNARTGNIQEMGADQDGLAAFMQTYGKAIRQHIDIAYPPAVDPESDEVAEIKARIAELHRPLVGKQIDATAIGASYLKRNKHLNLYFEPGSGKTCCSFAVAFGMRATKVMVMTPSRVVRNWIEEIQMVWPNAYIRVIDNHNPIGNRRNTSENELFIQPQRVERCSLEDARRMEAWATPDTPLWVILKKDTARRTYPVRHGMRTTGIAERADPRNLPGRRPLEHLRQAEARARRGKATSTREQPAMENYMLIRDGNGRLLKWNENDAPAGACPSCWYPLELDAKWKFNDRDAVCISPAIIREHPAADQILEECRQREVQNGRPVRGKHGGTWWSMGTAEERSEEGKTAIERARVAVQEERRLARARMAQNAQISADDNELVVQDPRTCGQPIGTAVRDESGRAYYSYGDYVAKYMKGWMDLFIVDEVQDYKAKETAQGETTRRIAQSAKKTMALTGTPFGGKVSEVFFLLLALNPGFGEAFGYRDVASFRRLYGREETVYTIKEDEKSRSVGASSRRRETKQNVREIPGYHPALLEFFWHNTLFMELKDVDTAGLLPPIRQRAHLVELDRGPQPDTTEQLSHHDAYEYLDREMTKHLRQELQKGSKRSLGLYLQEMLTYPENAWKGTAPQAPDTGKVIVALDPLSDKKMYPKERVLLELVRQQVRLGRKCLVYCTHTGRRDTTERLMRLIRMDGVRALQLKTGTVDSEERAEWLAREAKRNDVIVCQPQLVETGVNLLDYPTIIWYEIHYSAFLTEQASRRSYRLNQTEPVDIYYLAYANTMQERALRIIARKADVSKTFHGDLSKTGLSAFNPDPDDIRERLAREMVQSDTMDVAADSPDINEILATLDLGDMPEIEEIDFDRLTPPTSTLRKYGRAEKGEQLAMLS